MLNIMRPGENENPCLQASKSPFKSPKISKKSKLSFSHLQWFSRPTNHPNTLIRHQRGGKNEREGPMLSTHSLPRSSIIHILFNFVFTIFVYFYKIRSY